MSRPLRAIQSTTGNVAREAVRTARPDLELVGVFAHSLDKVGRDLADLVGLTESTGLPATDDIDALLALEPDCVVYTPLHLDVAHLTRILGAGVNVVTSSEFLTGRGLGEEARASIVAAAHAGQASIFGSGMNPGFGQLLAGIAAGASRDVRHVKMSESVDVSLYAADSNMDDLGWGRSAGDPNHSADLEAATLVFGDGLGVLTRLLGIESPTYRCTASFAHATADLDLPGRFIAAGTVAGIDLRWEALVDSRPVAELHQRWVMSNELDPPMPVEHGYVIEVAGDPNMRLRLDIRPDIEDFSSLTTDDIHSIGMRITALPVVNAIPMVCASEPGIRTYADLTTVSTRLQ